MSDNDLLDIMEEDDARKAAVKLAIKVTTIVIATAATIGATAYVMKKIEASD